MANLVGGSVVWSLEVDDSALVAGLNKANKSIDEASKSVEKSGFNIKQTFKDLGQSISSIGKDMSVGITAPIAAVGAVALNFVKVGGQYSSVLDSFKSMTQGMGVEAKSFQKAVSDATGGQLDDLTILQGATRGLSLIGKDAFNDFGSDFVKMAELSKKAARATGQDVDFMFNSLVLGISRESKLILDNLGISLDITKAKEDYAKSIGKTSDELTQSEEKHAVLNATLGQLQTTYGNVAVSAGGFSGAWQQMTTLLTNARIEIGQELEPSLSALIKDLSQIFKDVMPGVISVIRSAIDWFTGLDSNVQKNIIVFIGLVAAIGPVLVIVGTLISTLGSLLNPISLVIMAIVLLASVVISNWGNIKNAFNSGKDFISNAMNNIVNFLSSIGGRIVDAITSPFKQAFDTVKDVANKIKDAANEINPFVRHSPSLVDNVKKGIGVIRDEYASLRDVKLPSIMASLPTLSEPAYASVGMGAVNSGGGFKQDVNINIEKIQNQSDIDALGREFGYRQSLLI